MTQTRFPLKYKQKIKVQNSISRLKKEIELKEKEVQIDKNHLATLEDWLNNGLPLDDEFNNLLHERGV